MKRFILCLLVGIILLGACAEGEDVVVSTAVPTPLPTLEPTATETAVSTLPMHPPAATPIEIPVQLEEMFPTIPLTFMQSSDYDLRSPVPSILIDVLAMAIQQSNLGYSLEYESYSPWEDMDALLDMLQREFSELDQKDLPNASRLITDASLETTSFYCCDLYGPPAFQKPLQTAAAQYFHQYPSLITSGNGSNSDLHYSITEIDLGGDEDNEWFVEAELLRYGIRVFLPFELNENGELHLLPNDLRPQPGRFSQNSHVILEHDLNGDGRSEIIVITQIDGSTAWGYPGAIDIYSWNGEGLYQVQSIDIGGRTFAELARYEIADFTNDNKTDIRVYRPHSLRFGCSWDEIDTFSWQGNQVYQVVEGTEAPDMAVCQVEDALFAANPEIKAERLEAVLEQLSPDNAPSVGYFAMLKVHLAMAYAEMLQDSKAKEILNSIHALSSDSGYAQLVNEHYNSSNGSFIVFCQNLFQDGDLALDTDVGKYLIEGRPLHFVPLTSSHWLLCPFDSLLKGRLEITDFPESVSPIDTLALQNISVDFPFEMDNSSEVIWLGFIHANLIAWRLEDGKWQPSIIFKFESPVKDVQFDVRDSTEDGQIDLVVSIALKTPQYCHYVENKDEEYRLMLFTISPEAVQVISESTVCENPPSISQIELDYFDEKNSEEYEISWYLGIQADGQTWVFTYRIEDIKDQVLSQTNLSRTSAQIQDLISQIPDGDKGGELASIRLLYLIGLSYELSGDEETAVSTYLDLIQQYPTSPWSWLAWARLEPVEN